MKTLILHPEEQNIFFTSDLHLGHTNVIEYCNRPFESIIDMDTTIIQNWNNIITKDDLVFIIGDFCFHCNKQGWKNYLDQLNGFIWLIKGNHDRNIPDDYEHFRWIEGFLNTRMIDSEFDGGEQRLTMCHYPMWSWYHSHKESWQLFGHIHSGPNIVKSKEIFNSLRPSQYDVGVDNNDFTPVHWDQIKVILTNQLRNLHH